MEFGQAKIRRHDKRQPGREVAQRAVVPVPLRRRGRLMPGGALGSPLRAAAAHRHRRVLAVERDLAARVARQNDIKKNELIRQQQPGGESAQ